MTAEQLNKLKRILVCVTQVSAASIAMELKHNGEVVRKAINNLRAQGFKFKGYPDVFKVKKRPTNKVKKNKRRKLTFYLKPSKKCKRV